MIKEVTAGLGFPSIAFTAVADTDDKIWEGSIPIPSDYIGPYYLGVTGKDIADNVLDGDPPTIAYRDPNNPGQ